MEWNFKYSNVLECCELNSFVFNVLFPLTDSLALPKILEKKESFIEILNYSFEDLHVWFCLPDYIANEESLLRTCAADTWLATYVMLST